jgi:uroporphyrinogen-III synthase
MTSLVVIRPQPGCDATVAAARAIGLDAHGFPLFAIQAVDWDAPDPASIDALLIGSANALRHGGPVLTQYLGKPVYAVGETTGEAARQRGFVIAAVGEGGLQALLDRVEPEHRALLRLSGRERVAMASPEGVIVTERIVYASDPLPIPQALARLLAEPAVVLLHSAEAAVHFAGACDACGLARGSIALAALGPRIADAAGHGWAAIATADRPRDDALLALARQMCQTAIRSQG